MAKEIKEVVYSEGYPDDLSKNLLDESGIVIREYIKTNNTFITENNIQIYSAKNMFINKFSNDKWKVIFYYIFYITYIPYILG